MSNSLQALKITGKDALSFVHRQASNEIANLKDNVGQYAAFLTPQGKIKALVYILKASTDELLLIDLTNRIQATQEHLQKFAIVEDLNFEIIEPPEAMVNELAKLVLEDFSADDTLMKLDLVDKYVSFSKGCFPGQEVLSKYKNIGLKKRQSRSQEYLEEALDIFAKAKGQEAEAEANQTAIDLLKKAIKEDPKNEDAYESLGVILGRMQRYQEAIAVLQQLELINPSNIMAQTNLSIFYMKLGDKETAEQHKAKGTVLQFEKALNP